MLCIYAFVVIFSLQNWKRLGIGKGQEFNKKSLQMYWSFLGAEHLHNRNLKCLGHTGV